MAPLAGLYDLALGKNRIRDVGPLAGLTGLRYLSLGSNQVGDVTPLGGLSGLTSLVLDGNAVTDLAPLVTATGAAGGTILVYDNPLDCEAQRANITALTAREIHVGSDCAP